MYDELVKRIWECASGECFNCSQYTETTNASVCSKELMKQAADAIEELTGFVQEEERDRDEYRERLDKANDAIEELSKKRDAACWGCKCEKIEPSVWIPVTERLPEENGNYLVAVKCPRGKWVEICACDGRDWVSVDEYAEYATKWVTHWMPLPTQPKGEEE